ncbi:CRP/FNR family transcriptional regulator [Silvibacterium bohemicum]|uniref:CRP/FNR family transcriptional regulator n=1 Tax=Silvibacterium bohemicum TaxID=1577686 RepID=A0A841K292_9BACT|nr:Crp/Fnr family transcriptional regulator [Silvibacterium bohemicum]MBB6146049.1 CRP/FNR family transcriptional regulator [Silvibacterium bohemicum]
MKSLTEAASFSSVELFKGLPASHQQMLEEKSLICNFEAGHIFFRPGETGQVLFFLETGHVQTFRISGRKKLLIADLEPPAVFGEMGCVGQCMYHCTAQATEPSRIRTISRADLDNLLREHPQIALRMLDLVSERFLHVLLDLEATSFRPLIPRLAKLLIENAKDGCVQDLTHKKIAEQLRVYRESATTALGELKKAGIIAIERKQIRILDGSRLDRAAREQ